VTSAINIAGKRGNLGINAGDAAAVNVEFMFPPPTAPWKGIADGPTILLEFTLANMINYFVTQKVCDGEITGDFKHVNNHSYRLLYTSDCFPEFEVTCPAISRNAG